MKKLIIIFGLFTLIGCEEKKPVKQEVTIVEIENLIRLNDMSIDLLGEQITNSWLALKSNGAGKSDSTAYYRGKHDAYYEMGKRLDSYLK